MTTRMPRPGAIAVALVFALSVFAVSLFVWQSFGGTTPLQPEGYRVHVLFGPGGSQLVSNADVRIAGVKVGKVTRVRAAGLRTDAEIELQPRYVPLASDARAILRTKTLLGETFVALTPGSQNAPKLREGGRLATSRVEEPSGVDEVLATFDARTRRAFRGLFVELAAALEGRGADLNATLGNLAPGAGELRRLTEVLRRRDADVGALVRDTGVVLRTVARQDDAVGRLIAAGDDVFGATAARDRRLEATVRELPGFLREARGALRSAEGTARDAAPALRALRPVTPLLRPALEDAEELLPDVARLARRVGPVVDAAERGLPAAARTLDAARPVLRVLAPAGRQLVPVLETLEAYKDDLAPSLAKAAAALQGEIGGQHVMRVHFLMLNESFFGQERRAPTNRANAYLRPGGLDRLVQGEPLRALDCSNTANRQVIPVLSGSGPPPCLEQHPWTLRGKTAQFPGVEAGPP